MQRLLKQDFELFFLASASFFPQRREARAVVVKNINRGISKFF